MDRAMKDSGIEWIGDIPQEWEIRKVKNAFYRKKSKAQQESPVVLSLARSSIKIRDISTNEGQMAESYFDYNPVEPGDFLLNPMDLYSGANCNVSNVSGVISHAYINLKNHIGYCSRYYDYYFKTQYWAMALFAHGTGVSFDNRWTLNNETLMNYFIPVPTFDTQQRIAAYLDEKCKEIDSMIENTKTTIEEYKRYKYAVIVDAVTTGLSTNVITKNSSVDWIGSVPENWDIIKLKYLFSIKKEIANKLGYDVLSVTQSGLKIKDISSNEGQISSDYSKYQIVEPNDFVMNHMDLLTGWIDCSVFYGVTSPDYRVFRLVDESKALREYFKYIFQICYKHKIFYGLGQGVSNMGRWRLQSDKFLNFEIPLPPIEEQKKIVEFLDTKCSEIDILISKKQQLITELESYRNSLIYECVTGKRNLTVSENIQTSIIIYPLFPVKLATDKKRFAQAVLASKVIDTGNNSRFGRVKLEKILYTLETHIGFDFDTAYKRQVAGPLDSSIYQCENMICRRNKWFNIQGNKTAVKYSPTKDMIKYKNYYNNYFADYNSEIERIINIFRPLSTDQAEIIATLYASWNDFTIGGKTFTDDDIVNDVINNWHDSKKRFSKDIWLRAIEQMRKLDLVPKGYGKKTIKV